MWRDQSGGLESQYQEVAIFRNVHSARGTAETEGGLVPRQAVCSLSLGMSNTYRGGDRVEHSK